MGRLGSLVWWSSAVDTGAPRTDAHEMEVARIFHPDEFQTWYHAGHALYELDHVFADPTTASLFRSCEPEPYPAAVLGVSDHAPVVLDMEA